MSDLQCSQCGHALNRDVFSGEIRPCPQCGSVQENAHDKPQPSPEHQLHINKQKGFEIATVVILILVGLGYLGISSRAPEISGDGSNTLTNFSEITQSHGFDENGMETLVEKEFTGFEKNDGTFRQNVDLIVPTGSNSVEAIIATVTHPQGSSFPPDDFAEPALQKSFNDIIHLAESLIPASHVALEKAASTMTAGKSGVMHYKGVAQTSDGWKVTYINYRGFDESGEDKLLLLFLFQLLSVASDESSAGFNQLMYNAINAATAPKSSIRRVDSQ